MTTFTNKLKNLISQMESNIGFYKSRLRRKNQPVEEVENLNRSIAGCTTQKAMFQKYLGEQDSPH